MWNERVVVTDVEEVVREGVEETMRWPRGWLLVPTGPRTNKLYGFVEPMGGSYPMVGFWVMEAVERRVEVVKPSATTVVDVESVAGGLARLLGPVRGTVALVTVGDTAW